MSILKTFLMNQGQESPLPGLGVEVFPGLVVFEGETGGWSVTHVASGMAVTKCCCCVYRAVAVAEEIGPLIDWSRPVEEISAQGTSLGISLRVSEVKCPYSAMFGDESGDHASIQ